ncbi:MAG: 30S ribosome-binding factor RbfA [Mycoplasmataceae bacterium]|jgi:ribosome-binding factor A|nr:30S ribosome-binding factor RbfA [Mycoplasmataceae bacterium]
MHSNHKHEHIESEILNVINHTIKSEIYDESLKHCSFTAVKLSPDYSFATIYVDTYDRSKIEHMLEKLTIAKGVFRSQLAQYMRIRKIPDIRFVKDETIDNSLKIDQLLDKI